MLSDSSPAHLPLLGSGWGPGRSPHSAVLPALPSTCSYSCSELGKRSPEAYCSVFSRIPLRRSWPLRVSLSAYQPPCVPESTLCVCSHISQQLASPAGTRQLLGVLARPSPLTIVGRAEHQREWLAPSAYSWPAFRWSSGCF